MIDFRDNHIGGLSLEKEEYENLPNDVSSKEILLKQLDSLIWLPKTSLFISSFVPELQVNLYLDLHYNCAYFI